MFQYVSQYVGNGFLWRYTWNNSNRTKDDTQWPMTNCRRKTTCFPDSYRLFTMRSLRFTIDFTTIWIYFGKTYHHFTTIFTNMFYHHRGSAIFAARSRCFNRSWQINPKRHGKELKRRNVKRMWKIENSPDWKVPSGKFTVWPWKYQFSSGN